MDIYLLNYLLPFKKKYHLLFYVFTYDENLNIQMMIDAIMRSIAISYPELILDLTWPVGLARF